MNGVTLQQGLLCLQSHYLTIGLYVTVQSFRTIKYWELIRGVGLLKSNNDGKYFNAANSLFRTSIDRKLVLFLSVNPKHPNGNSEFLCVFRQCSSRL